jgi:hypothetical protein
MGAPLVGPVAIQANSDHPWELMRLMARTAPFVLILSCLKYQRVLFLMAIATMAERRSRIVRIVTRSTKMVRRRLLRADHCGLIAVTGRTSLDSCLVLMRLMARDTFRVTVAQLGLVAITAIAGRF